MKIPKKVKIGGVTYVVEFRKNDTDTMGVLNLGQLHYHHGKLSIDENMPKDIQEQVFLHEVTHGMLRMMGRKDLNEDEYFVDGLSYILHQIMRDNNWTFGKESEDEEDE